VNIIQSPKMFWNVISYQKQEILKRPNVYTYIYILLAFMPSKVLTKTHIYIRLGPC
jgi:hypothetical protein